MEHLLSPRTWTEHKIFELYRYLSIKAPHEIDLELIAESCQIEIISISGRSYITSHPIRKGWMLICIDSLLSELEQREKIAHEVFHCLAHEGNQLTLPPAFIKLQESQSKAGAAHLLMPLWMLTHYDFTMEPKFLVHTLSNTFRVSFTFTIKQLQLIQNRIKEEKSKATSFDCLWEFYI